MKLKNILQKTAVSAVIFALSFTTVNAQNDTMYLMKSGIIVEQYNVTTEIDSIIFYKPTQSHELLEVGDFAHGGVVFWVDPIDQTKGLVCAVSDQSSEVPWNINEKWISTQEAAIGTGQANTTTIIAEQGAGDYAASVAKACTDGGFSDWFLPSKDELKELYDNHAFVNKISQDNGGTALSNHYWSSSQYDTKNAYCAYFRPDPYGALVQARIKTDASSVRAVRAFDLTK